MYVGIQLYMRVVCITLLSKSKNVPLLQISSATNRSKLHFSKGSPVHLMPSLAILIAFLIKVCKKAEYNALAIASDIGCPYKTKNEKIKYLPGFHSFLRDTTAPPPPPPHRSKERKLVFTEQLHCAAMTVVALP